MSIKTLFRWHLWLGLLSGIFLFLVGLTGAIAVFAEEIDWLVIPPLRAKWDPQGQRAAPEAIIANIKAAYPDGQIGTMNFSDRPSFAHKVSVSVPENGRRRGITVYVDPGTGSINGETRFGGGYFGSAYQFIRQSHVRLLMGRWGRVFVGVLGVTLTLSCITGIWIYRGWIKKLFQLRIKGSWGARPPWAETHKFIGVWSLLFNIVIGLSGAVLGLENLYNSVESNWFPSERTQAEIARAATEKEILARNRGAPMGPSEALSHAKRLFPDLTVRSLSIPAKEGAPIVMQGDVPNPLVAQSHVRRRNSLRIHPTTGEEISRVDGREDTGWTRIYWMLDPLHFGYFGGLFTKIVWFILGLTPSFLAVSGTIMWWRRRAHAAKPGKAAAPAGVPAESVPAGARRVPRWVVPTILVATLICAYAVVAQDRGSWAFTHALAEHWLVKPITLAVAAFPITGLLAWLVYRSRERVLLYSGTWIAIGAWYVLLTGTFLR
jgi:uncharacterized iron-regulated membrane protein